MYNDNRDHRLRKRQIRSEMLKKRDSLSPSFVLAAEDCLRTELAEFLSAKKNTPKEDVSGRFRHSGSFAVSAFCDRKKESLRPLTIMSYMSFRNEFPTHSFNRWIIAEGMRLILPETDRDFRLHARLTENPGELVRSSFGAAQPDPERCPEVPADEPDVIIFPGVAFDRCGNRIGFGKGCYDRFLADRKRPVIRIGAAYRFQISEKTLPAEPDDIPVDWIVTEQGILCCGDHRTQK